MSRRKVRMTTRKHPTTPRTLSPDQHRAEIIAMVNRLGYNEAASTLQSDWNLPDTTIAESNARLKPLSY